MKLLKDGSKEVSVISVVELRELIKVEKNIVLFDTVEQFKATLGELLKNDSLIESISSSGNQFVQGRFSYDQMALEIINKFQELQRTSA